MIAAMILFATVGQPGSPPCDLSAARARTTEAERAEVPAERARLARAAIALCEGHAPAHNALATALEALKDYETAAAEYARAAALEPSWYLPRLGLGDVARARGELEQARASYQAALDLSRTSAERDEATAALAQLPEKAPSSAAPENPEAAGFAFKSADAIARGLHIGEAARSPGGTWVEEPAGKGKDFYEGGQGYAANFTILFEVGSASLLADGMRQLDEIGRALQSAAKGERYVIEGHASSEGGAAFNRELSAARARSARDYLVGRFRLAAAVIEAVGRGTEDLVIENGVENAVKSRRVTVVRRYDR
jgi:outer membrane protein OmpA-like peptidoglycan-associated protein